MVASIGGIYTEGAERQRVCWEPRQNVLQQGISEAGSDNRKARGLLLRTPVEEVVQKEQTKLKWHDLSQFTKLVELEAGCHTCAIF